MKEGGGRGGEEKFQQEYRLGMDLRENGGRVCVFAFPRTTPRIVTSVHSHPIQTPHTPWPSPLITKRAK